MAIVLTPTPITNVLIWDIHKLRVWAASPTLAIMSEESKYGATGGDANNFVGEDKIVERVNLSRRTIYDLRVKGVIPYIRLGGRRIIYHWPSVEAALLRAQRGGQL